ncbi:putative bifunctional diguanylate cyclase/phosphodiesterase [Bacillus dakarensis]|uniref:putative bifunctional diguanylate cyclase/phosphodiesterase n=1 Tax=Robertmurraya dakarensis TaxID=1926278 RepID=UPI000980E2E7|nr:EAL domain-containing protein [Bacillus dakarensis]
MKDFKAFKALWFDKGFFLFLILAGFVIGCSSVSFHITFGVTLTLTSVFLFLILRLYGLVAGLVAGVIGLLFARDGLYSIAYAAIGIIEIAFVGAFFYKGRRAKMFFVDGLFWLTIGLAALYFLNAPYLTGQSLYFELSRVIVNGLLNVLIADMLLAYFPFYKVLNHLNKNSVSIHQFLSHITFTSILVPFLLVMTMDISNMKEVLLLFLLLAIFIIILVLVVSRIFMKNLQQLTTVTTGLPQKLISLETVEWPVVYVSELRLLTHNLMNMANTLKNLFQESLEMNRILTEQTKKLKESEDQLHKLAFYDNLTKLPNRLHFQNYVKDLILIDDKKEKIAIIFIDLNQFKQINDTLGHDAGDELLQITANRLAGLQKNGRDIFRMGGDEFVIVHRFENREEIELTIALVLEKFSEAFSLQGQSQFITASLGVSVYPDHGRDLDTLLKYADIAMYASKESGGNISKFFDESMKNKFQERFIIENALRNVVEQGGFELYYQPKIHFGAVTSLEALIRWKDSKLGVVSPAAFIPIAEDSDLIYDIDKWSLTNACLQNKKWQDQGCLQIPISVNLSAKHFQQNYIVSMVAEVLERVGLEPEYLKIEVTESVFIENPHEVAEMLWQLKNLGVMISIDDFGKGYSSLYHLLKLPVDEIKIDRQFINGIDKDEKKELLVEAILQYANRLSLNVVAEGVETVSERDVLTKIGCHELQGYLFSPPVNESEIIQFLVPANVM